MARVVTDDKHYKDIASKIREKTASEGLIYPEEMSAKVGEVYESGVAQGRSEEWNEFWDNFQDYGNRINYNYGLAGYGFTANNFYPKYDIKPEGYQANIFYAWNDIEKRINLKQRLEECGVILDTSKATNISSMFAYSFLGTIPTIDCTSLSGDSTGVFSHTYGRVTEIEKIITKETVTYRNWFINTNLNEIRFEGVIGNDIDFQHSTSLSKASIESIITHLSDTASGKTATFSQTAVNNAFTSEEWTALANTKPNWTISLI
jgi:hypothetical protein